MKFSKEHIIESIKNGNDREVLAEVYKELYPKVDRYIKKNSGTSEDSKDVFQEAVLVFYQLVVTEKYHAITNLTGFIIAVCRNIWINKVKKLKNEVEVDVLEVYEDFTPSPLISMIMEEKWAAYSKLFNSLGTKCKELLTYSVYQKLSMKEIAIKMDFSNEHSAKAQNYRCKQKLIDIVKENKALKDLLMS